MAAAVTAAGPVILSFVVALPVWMSLRELWNDEEDRGAVTLAGTGGGEEERAFLLEEMNLNEVKAEMDWVAH